MNRPLCIAVPVLLLAGPAASQTDEPPLLSPETTLAGRSQVEWSVRWWQWA